MICGIEAIRNFSVDGPSNKFWIIYVEWLRCI